jgi:dihydropteroate synthase
MRESDYPRAKESRLSSLADFANLPPPTIWLRPIGLLRGSTAASAVASGAALPLAAGPLAFPLVETLALHNGRLVAAIASLAELRSGVMAQDPALAARIAEQLATLSAKRPIWAGLSFDRPLIMGVLNVTPDSFSDGGDFSDPSVAVAHGRAMLAAGADIIDIGGESTRPGAAPVSPAVEIARVEPVISGLAAAGAVVSIDTRQAAVMDAALAKGARIVNDVSALTSDPGSREIVAKSGAAVVLMHMRGEPRTMQQNPTYDDAPVEVAEYLAARIADCAAAGIPRERIVVDPGIGFGKDKAHNLEILDRITLLHALGCGILLGVSRKSLIGRVTNAVTPKDRLPGSLAGALHGIEHGVQIVRVHDVAETRQAIAVAQAIAAAT